MPAPDRARVTDDEIKVLLKTYYPQYTGAFPTEMLNPVADKAWDMAMAETNASRNLQEGHSYREGIKVAKAEAKEAAAGLVASNRRLTAAMKRYEMDVDTNPTDEHKAMMKETRDAEKVWNAYLEGSHGPETDNEGHDTLV